MARVAQPIAPTDAERRELERMVRMPSEQRRYAERAGTVLLAAAGLSNVAISEQLRIPVNRVSRWKCRFVQGGVEALRDRPRSGRRPRYGHDALLKIVDTAVHPPEGRTHWTVRGLADHLAQEVGIRKSQTHKVLKDMDIKPHRVEQWLNSTDPDFEAKQAEVVGLYLNPPENALVISVDEKTQMLVREPKRPSKPMRPGTPERREFEYVRHGVQSLFAALLVHDGRVLGRMEPTHSHVEFTRFLELIDEETPDDHELHLILDNLQVHKTPEVKQWLADPAHARFKIHFTPTHASWLNQIEIWFSILARQLLRRGIFTSREDQAQQIIAFIERYNRTARPFAWTSKGKVLTA